MGKNKKLRQRRQSHLENISRHRRKIEDELKKPTPDKGLIEVWEKQIGNMRKQVEKIDQDLPQKKEGR